MDEIISKIGGIKERFDKHIKDRNAYAKDVAVVFKEKNDMLKIHKTLKNNVETLSK